MRPIVPEQLDWQRAALLAHVGAALRNLKRFDEGRERFTEALDISQVTNRVHFEAAVRRGLGGSEYKAGNPGVARDHLDEALSIFQDIGDTTQARSCAHWLDTLRESG